MGSLAKMTSFLKESVRASVIPTSQFQTNLSHYAHYVH